MRIYQSTMKYLITIYNKDTKATKIETDRLEGYELLFMTYLKEEAFGIESITVRNLQTNKLIAMFSNDIQLQSNNF